MWIDVDNPGHFSCTSTSTCDSKLEDAAGTLIRTNTYMDNHDEFTFNLGTGSASRPCVSLVRASSLLASDCGVLNHAFCEATCTGGEDDNAVPVQWNLDN